MFKRSNPIAAIFAFIASTARLETGEEFQKRGSEMASDDACATVNQLIGAARELNQGVGAPGDSPTLTDLLIAAVAQAQAAGVLDAREGDTPLQSAAKRACQDALLEAGKVPNLGSFDGQSYYEPWLADSVASIGNAVAVQDTHGKTVALVPPLGDDGAAGSLPGPNQLEYAIRVALCVSYCEGVNSSDLEGRSLVDFRQTASDVVNSWEKGDLAGAVANLQGAVEDLGGSFEDEEETEESAAVAG